jgi:hypothetical protein
MKRAVRMVPCTKDNRKVRGSPRPPNTGMNAPPCQSKGTPPHSPPCHTATATFLNMSATNLDRPAALPHLTPPREEGISVHDALPASTHRGKLILPPADRIHQDPGQCANRDPLNTDHDFLAIGPALRILQLNVEGLSESV